MDPSDGRISVNLRAQDGGVREYKIGKETPMVRLLKKHCERVNIDLKAAEFLIKGHRFDHKKTPAQLNLKDNCVIEVFVHVDGGGPNRV